MHSDNDPAPTASRDIEMALARARRIAANLNDSEDRRVIEQYVADLERLRAATRRTARS